MCNCSAMVRIPDQETNNGRWPMPLHHPKCEDYKTERFVRVGLDGQWCVMEPGDAIDFMDDVKYDDDAERYIYEDIYITRDQYNSLPEMEGF